MVRLLILAALCLFAGSSWAEPIWVAPASDQGDSGPAIRDAIFRASAQGAGAEVRLKEGVFTICSAADDNWFFVVGGKDFSISGEGEKTRIVFTDPRKGGFLVSGAQRVSIRGITVDYDPLPFTQGTIVSVDAAKNQFDLRLDDGFPLPDATWFATGQPVNQMGVLFDAVQRRLKAGAPDYFIATGWAQKSANLWTIHLSDAEPGKAASMANGDRFALLSRRGNGALLFSGTQDCLIEDVFIGASPSLTIALTGSDRMIIRRVTIGYENGSARLVTSNGDGIHCQQNRRGPLIEGCLFEGLCDDGLNIYTVPLVVKQVISPEQIAVTCGSAVRVGDTLQIFDPQSGVIRAEPVATEVQQQDQLQIITLDRAVVGVVAGADHRTADTVFDVYASGAGYVIRNNHFRNHRRFGVNLRAGDGLVEGNTFEELGGFGVSIGNEPAWPEGPAACNITIRGNIFLGGAYCAGYGNGTGGPGIHVFGLSLNGIAHPPLLRQIRIESNRFTRAYDPAIQVRSARDVVIRDNRATADDHPTVRADVEMCEAVEVDPK